MIEMKHTVKFQDLRNKAEEMLVKNKDHPTVIKTEIDELIHELEVYQIELEMQNEELVKTQIKLEESRDSYIQLYDFAPVGYFTLDQNWIITRVNLTGSALLGLPKSNLMNTAFFLYITPDYRKIFYEHCKEVRKRKRKCHCEVELASKNSNPFFTHLDTIEMGDNKGNFKEFMITVTDISELKKAEIELRRLNGRINIASQAAGAGIWDWNIKTDHLEWSPMMFDLFGLDPRNTEASFEAWENTLHPEDLKMASNNIQIAIEEHTFLDNQYRIVLPDGQIRWINALGKAEYDDQGLPTAMIGICIDITDHIQMKIQLEEMLDNLEKLVDERTRELKLSNRYNRNLIETSLDPLVTIGPDGMITDVNRATEDVTGYVRSEIVGTDFADYFTKPDKAKEGYKLVFQKGIVRDYPLEIKHENGSITPVLYNAAVYKDEFDEVIGVFAAARDISKLKYAENELREYWKSLEEQVELRTAELAKRSEELAKSNEDLKQFAYVASHDLREPLRMITSFLQLLEQRYKDQLDQDANEFIGFAVDGAKRLDKMIMDLLEYSRVANKKIMFEDINLNNVLYHVKSNLKVLIDENDATINFDSLPCVKGDSYQMILLFQNLISNAIKYRQDEDPIIHVSADKKVNQYVFSVKDNGIGIDSNYLSGIFNIFKRLHTHEEYEGTGIGLAIAQRIVHQHGGEIWAESEKGNGSTFYFTIPNFS